jgi:hypothetical protein
MALECPALRAHRFIARDVAVPQEARRSALADGAPASRPSKEQSGEEKKRLLQPLPNPISHPCLRIR